MDLKRLGVSIDPRGARQGAAQVNKSLQEMGSKARRVLTETDRQMLKMGRSGQVAGDKIKQGSDKATGALKRTSKAAKQAGRSANAAGKDLAFMEAQGVLAAAGLFRASAAMGMFAGAAGGAMAALAPLLAVLLPIIVAVKAFSALFAAGVEGTKLAGEIQRLHISFTALTGSSREATKVLDELRRTALQTGVAVADQATTVQKFIALGFSSGDAIQLQKNILDVAGAVGLTATEAKLLGSALAQVQSKGVVSMEELRQQIAEKGIPAIDELMKKTGMFGKEFFDAIAKGEIPAQELIDIFLNLEGSFAKFEGGSKRLAKSIPGQVNIVKTSWQELLRVMGEPIAEAVGPIFEDLINILQTAKPFAEAMGRAIGDTIKILYQAISDGTLSELLATAFMAGIETGLNFLANGFIEAVLHFGSLIVTAIEHAGAVIGKVFMDVFAEVINFFAAGIEKILRFASNAAVKVAAAAGKEISLPPIAEGAIGRVEGGGEVTPFGDRLAANNQFAAFGAEQLKDPFGSFFNDRAARQAGNLIDKFNTENAGKNFTFAGGGDEALPPGVVPTTDPTGGGGAGAEGTKKANEELREQATILESLRDRLSEIGTEWSDLGVIVADIAEGAITSFADNLSNALTNVATGAESAGEAFRNMANAVVQSIVQMVIQMMVQLAVAQALAALGVPVGTFSGIAGAARAVPVNHAGGNGGNVKTGRGGMSKFHDGGVLSSENVGLTDQNETVLTRRRAEEVEQALKANQTPSSTSGPSEGGRPLQIVNVLDKSEVLEMVAANPDVTINAISRRRRQVNGMLKEK
jgi:tape measure domain-containing protein